MKIFIILFLISFNVEALTIKERYQALPDIRLAMDLCSFTNSSIKRMVKQDTISGSEINILCLESKTANVQQILDNSNDRENDSKNALTFIRAADCSVSAVPNNLLRALCVYHQR